MMEPTNQAAKYALYFAKNWDVFPSIPSESVDAIIADPPYPEVDRSYGRMSESEWFSLMDRVCGESRRILKPTGSAVFILQSNYSKVGSVRGWLWEFMAWICREWNMVQDVWWWNTTAMPAAGATEHGLLRQSVKACVWAGAPDCYRNQQNVLWTESQSNAERRASAKFLGRQHSPSGHSKSTNIFAAAAKRGGVTPFNLLPVTNSYHQDSAGNFGHSAGTPLELARWWVRYICPPGGTVMDPFMGSGTMGLAAMQYGCKFIGIEKEDKEGYYPTALERIAKAAQQEQLSFSTFVPIEEQKERDLRLF